MNQADHETWETIRHEGAHQLFYNYGIHSRYRFENDWLIEGLAVYCETRPLGSTESGRASVLKKSLRDGKLLSPESLVNLRSVKGLFALDDPDQISLAYMESWSVNAL